MFNLLEEDEKIAAFEIADNYGGIHLPSFIILNSKSKLLHIFKGRFDEEFDKDEIKDLLKSITLEDRS